MFETAELGRSLSKRDYEKQVPALRSQLLKVQNELRVEAPFSVLIVINGVDGAGKGETVNRLHEWMDPRFLEAHAFGPPSDEERERPPMWRFLRVLPPKGRLGIFFGSWYSQPILNRAFGRSSEADLLSAMMHINVFEKMLVDDGTLVLKYWFHLSKKAQRKRLKELSKDPKLSWRVTEQDWKHFELYDTFVPICERAIRETSTGEAPWTIVEGADERWREVAVGKHLLDNIQRRLTESRQKRKKPRAPRVPKKLPGPTILSEMDLSRSIPKKKYDSELLEWQGKLARLARKANAKGISVLWLFEGQDAAGKGGAIRRVNRALDARHYKVIPIAAPNDEERARHYLWRFWRHLPRAGQVVIFDRSYYGRVLVERVEGFASEDEWRRAYKEINEFEDRLVSHNMALAKFWLQIDAEEQLNRFKAREQTSYKQYKITDEDWRNREKWPLYELAVNEMVTRTSTHEAPWTLVAANDKRYARIQVLETCCESLNRALEQAKKNSK